MEEGKEERKVVSGGGQGLEGGGDYASLLFQKKKVQFRNEV